MCIRDRAEHAIETAEISLRERLTAASTGVEAPTFSYTDQVASCTVRGAPDLAARLFATEVETAEETAALQRLAPVINYCAREGAAIEASPLAMRAMLATAAWRLLAANPVNSEESEDDA